MSGVVSKLRVPQWHRRGPVFGRAPWRRATAVLLVGGLLMLLAAPASADGLFDCKTAPTPRMPTSGLTGYLLGGPPGPGAGNTSVYAKYGTVPSTSTYDLGCGGSARDPNSSIDNTVSNWLLGTGKTLVAATNALHNLVAPPSFLARLDPLVRDGTKSVHDALYTPWIGLSLLLLAIVLLVRSVRGSLHWAVSAVAWALLIMAGAAAVTAYPVQAGQLADSTVTSVVGDVNAHTGGNSPTESPAASRASLITDSVLWHAWLRAELGSDSSAVAQKYGSQLLDSQAYTWDEAATIQRDPGAAKDITKRKQAEFKDVASKISDEDPDAYEHLKGQSGDREGAAMLALFAALAVTPFMLLADLLVVAALLILRLAVIFFPALAVVGLHGQLAGLIRSTLNTVAAALINAVVFCVGAAINALAVRLILSGGNGLPGWFQLLLCALFSYLLWVALKPFRRLTAMVNPHSSPIDGAAKEMRGHRRGVRKLVTRAASAYFGAKTGAAAGAASASKDEGSPDGGADASGQVPAQRTEAWSRPSRSPGVLGPPASPARPPEASHALPVAAPPRVPSDVPAATDDGHQLAPARVRPPTDQEASTAGLPDLPAVAGASDSTPDRRRELTATAGADPAVVPAVDAANKPANAEPDVLPPGGYVGQRPPHRSDPVVVDGRLEYRIYVPGEGVRVVGPDGELVEPGSTAPAATGRSGDRDA